MKWFRIVLESQEGKGVVMTVTDITFVKSSNTRAGVLAECSIILDDEIQIHNIKLVEGKAGVFLAFPYHKVDVNSQSPRKFKDIVHPTSKNTRQYLTNIIYSKYKEEFKNSSEDNTV